MSTFYRLLLSPPACRDVERLGAKVSGKTILITGASFGIGEATALLLARAGAEVILLARTQDKLDVLVDQIKDQGGTAHAYAADLYKMADIPTLMQQIQAAHPRIDIVVSNAGKSIRRRITDSFGRDDLERTLALNFSSPAALLMALFPRMIAQGGGQIINVSTISVKQPSAPRWGTYQSTKTGFDVWLRSVANELYNQNILVSSVYLPLVRTRMIAPTKMWEKLPALSPLEAAQSIAYAIVYAPDRVAPWWLWPSELMSLLVGTPLNRLLSFWDARDPF